MITLVLGFYSLPDLLLNLSDLDFPGLAGVAILVGIVVVILLITLAYSYLAWRRMAYAISDDSVLYRSGIIFRSQRTARLDRIQSIDINRPLLGRVVGLASLVVDSAGGSDANVTIEYLRDAEAERLRAEILAKAAGLRSPAGDAATPGAAPQFARAPEQVVYELPNEQLLRSMVYEFGTLIVVGVTVIGVILLLGFGLEWGPGIAIPAGLILIIGGWSQSAAHYGHTLAISPDGLRLRHGLLTHQSQTVPPGRIQAVRLTQPLLWRKFDWWRLEMDVAGYGASAANQGDANEHAAKTLVLPVAPRGVALHALWIIQRDLGVDDVQAVLEAGLTGKLGEAGFQHSPPAARWLDPISWQRNGLLITRTVMLMRSGRLNRRLAVVPHERTQSLAVSQGPIQRLLGIASFRAHSVPGPVKPHTRHLPALLASDILVEQAGRAREARAKEGPEQWMHRVSEPAPMMES